MHKKKLYAFFLLLPLLCAGAAAQPKWGENLVKNPGFSDGMTGWLRNDDFMYGGIYPYGAVVPWSDEGCGKSAGDSCLAFSFAQGKFTQIVSLHEHGFSAADLDGASLVVSVEAYYPPCNGCIFSSRAFSALFVLSDTTAYELVPDAARGGLLSWTTFSDTIPFRADVAIDTIGVELSGCSGNGWYGYYGPKFDNVSVSVIPGGATALPPSPAVASDASAPLFDLQGRRVASPVRGRPYVQGGRLKVAR